MKIDRSNYEIWLIDWLDGNLNDFQIQQVKIFLNENPELKEEFEEISSFNIKPVAKSFPNKILLKRSISEIPKSQFEYLSVAFLENDITPEQKSELTTMMDQDNELRKSFALIQKTRLTPGNDIYRKKNLLIKKTGIQKVFKLSVGLLSAAAAVALIIVTYLLIPRNINEPAFTAEQSIATDSSIIEQPPAITPESLTADNKPHVIKQERVNKPPVIQKLNPVPNNSDLIVIKADVSSDSIPYTPDIELKKLKVNVTFDFNKEIIGNSLVASYQPIDLPSEIDDRSKIGKFIAKTFREKILKETVTQDTPLKAYEIAEAGITGLNNLFGWEMALDEKNDENGQLKSVYFSSRVLKFNAPVKKSEPIQ